jgi:hypothetical protein
MCGTTYRCYRWKQRLLKCVFTLDMERCPRRQSATLRLIAALTFQPLVGRLLNPFQVAAAPASCTGTLGAKAVRLGIGSFAMPIRIPPIRP